MTKACVRVAVAVLGAVLAWGGSVAAADWTVFTPSLDSRVVYVSSSAGNDLHTGLTPLTPKRTISAGYALLRDGHPDWLLLKSGDVWHERVWWGKSGRSASEMMRMGSYGAGARPRLLTGSESGIDAIAPNHLGGRRFVAITDLHLKADGYNGSNGLPNGISFLGLWSDVLIENCLVEGYFVNMPLQGSDGFPMRNLRVRRNVIVDAYRVGSEGHAQGLYLAYCEGALIEENLFDHNGWSQTVAGADPTIFRHNVYIHPGNTSGVTTRANIVARGAASGLRSGGDVSEFNLCLANPVNLIAGETTRTIRYNVILDSRDIGPGHPIGMGITGTFRDCEVYGNILAHRTAPSMYNIAAIQLGDGSADTVIRDNTVCDWAGPGDPTGAAVFINGSMARVTVRDNVFQQGAGGRLAWAEPAASPAPVFFANRYFSPTERPFATPLPGPIFGATYAQWVAATQESGSSFAPVYFPSSARTVGGYMLSLGLTPTLEAFLTEARKQSRAYWRPAFAAMAAGNHFRAAFGVVIRDCPADFTGEGEITVTDFVLFRNAYNAGDPRSDINRDGTLNINDFVAFEIAVATGCP